MTFEHFYAPWSSASKADLIAKLKQAIAHTQFHAPAYHGQWSHLPDDEIIRRMNHSLPPVRFPQHLANDLGNKCCATLVFVDARNRMVVPAGKEALWGINAMERDDEL